MVFTFHRSKNRSTFLSEPNLAWFEWRELSILDRLESGPRSCSALLDWVVHLSGSSTGPLGAAAFISLSPSASIYKGGEEARPDGICHKMLLQHWQSTFLIVVLSKRERWEPLLSQDSGEKIQDEFRTMISHHPSSLRHIDVLTAHFFMLGTVKVIIVLLHVIYRGLAMHWTTASHRG